jgi:hypothetical protein
MGMSMKDTEMLECVYDEMLKAEKPDTIHKLYRQTRTWARFECFVRKPENESRYRHIVDVLKDYKSFALRRIA